MAAGVSSLERIDPNFSITVNRALLIGASDYQQNGPEGWRDLPGVKGDLPAIAASLKRFGFVSEIILDKNSDEITDAIETFIDEWGYTQNARLIVYFAGHGDTQTTADGREMGYVVPVDTPTFSTDQLGFKRKAISMDQMVAFSTRMEARQVMFIFDSCFAGSVFDQTQRSERRRVVQTQDPIRYFIAAGRKGETVPDASVFRSKIEIGLAGAADRNRDGIITDDELGDYLSEEVTAEVFTHQPQHGPLIHPVLGKGRFYFRLPRAENVLEQSISSYFAGQFDADKLLQLWRSQALDGDARVMKHLGDVYSDSPMAAASRPDLRFSELSLNFEPDLVEAFSWYMEAALRANEDAVPSRDEIAIKAAAQGLSFEVAAKMTDAEYLDGQTRLISRSADRPKAFKAIARAYQEGRLIEKDNTSAVQFYMLSEKLGETSATKALQELMPRMQRSEVVRARRRADDWSPQSVNGRPGATRQSTLSELERLKRELEELRLEDSLEAVADIDVSIIQNALSALGFYDGAIDNKVGPQTREAIRRFQSALAARDGVMSAAQRRNAATGVLAATEAVRLIRLAAEEADDALSQYTLGIMYVRGIGVARDGSAGVGWLKKASVAGLAVADYALGVIYRDGTTGINAVTPSRVDSEYHFRRASENGYGPAKRALGDAVATERNESTVPTLGGFEVKEN
ncbi:MAG: caspase family protein [Pseudomonadota bacterium]